MTDSTMEGGSTGYEITTQWPTLSDSIAWPKESESGALDAFYGNPRGEGSSANPSWEKENLTTIQCPWQFKEGGHAITIHKRCAESLSRVLNAVWTSQWVNQSQTAIAATHLDEWGGSYNYRRNVNAPSKLSLHAYGAAFDMAPDRNPNGSNWVDGSAMLPRYFIDAMLSEGWCWGGDFNVTKDPMHFQATFNAHKDAVPIVTAPPLIPVIPLSPAHLTSDQQLARMRQFLIDETGLSAELEAFKTGLLADLEALKSKINNYSVEASPAAALPLIPTPPTLPPVIGQPPIVVPPVKAAFTATGKCSMFGGPNDTGVAPDEGLAFISKVADAPHLFLPDQPVGTTGLARRLNPAAYYVACRWDYNITPKPSLLRDVALVRAAKTGRAFTASPADWGPNSRTGRVADLSPGLMEALGIQTDDICEVLFPASATAPLGQSGSKMPTPSQVTVPVQSPLASKVNWTAAVQIIATLLTVFSGGKMGLTADQQAMIVGVIGTIAPLATIAFRTFGTTSITPQSLP